ncbi:terpene synthase metal binding domain-containing protein [Ilyonectria robusta]|uniref:terpene synthase metal binding domain-containing protein n=1 Tax=Ilyonectria robusta TaxID=1079257 RepID=UPI001E8D0EC4|nr:terpene synthase metal binding domain-containing protein [Ilyonectria robusta]KAH8675039.1 terpene synthase metal binding domain-containing protein [Ilyonectria robusta]
MASFESIQRFEDKQDDMTEVLLPDMFKSFLKDYPKLNPHYAAVKATSEKWLIETCSLSPAATKCVRECDFTYFCAIVYADAPLEEFQVVSDWGNWVFPFDDMFDEGELRDDPQAAQDMMDSLMSKMLGLPYHGEKSKLVQAHDIIFERLCQNSSPETTRRYIKAMADYRDSVMSQVCNASAGTLPEVKDMLKTRSRSIAAWAMYVMIEYAHGLDIPSEILEHSTIKALEMVGLKIIAIANDIVSYRKEEVDSVPHNMVAVCRMRGLSAQQAFGTVGALLDSQLAAWEDHLGRVPSWGSKADVEVEKYIEGIRNMARANLRSSFRSQRYFGQDASKVERTRKLNVLSNPPWGISVRGA